ncbi:MAG: tetratricopeptide repeat protein [Myxococcaceae bacterium]|nr:tetratricopeptide repeat protein [Myxococcaceae bacterium]
MRTALCAVLLSSAVLAAPRAPVVALLPPQAADDDLRGFGLMLEARASELIEETGRFSELHIKQVLSMADAEGLDPLALSQEANAKKARAFLGADLAVTVSLAADPKAMTLTGAVIDGKKTTPFTAKLPITWPEALRAGSEAIAKAVLATEKVALPKKPKTQPDSSSPEAVRLLAQCYATVIRQPLGVDNPAVIDGPQLEAAAAQCEKALENDKQLTFAHAVLALARAIIGDHARAAAALAAVGDGNDVIEPYTLARFWMVTRFQSNEAGLASLRDVLKKHPTELIALNYLADTQSVLNDHSGAGISWTEYLSLVPASPYAQARLSKALARQNRHDEAIAAARKALELAPDSRAARLELGSRFIDANKPDDAITTLAAVANPSAEGVLRLGWAYWLKGEVGPAEGHFQKALELAQGPGAWRTRGRAHYNLALVAMKKNAPAAAKAALKASLQTGFKLRTVDAALTKVAQEVEREGFGPTPDAGSPKLTLGPKESSLFPFDASGDALPAAKKEPAPQGFIIYKF